MKVGNQSRTALVALVSVAALFVTAGASAAEKPHASSAAPAKPAAASSAHATSNTKVNNTKVNNTAVNNTKVNNTKVNNTTVNNTKVNNTKVNNTTVNNTKVNNTKVNNTTVNNTKVNNTKVNNTTVNNTKVNNTTVNKTKVNNTTINKTTINNTTINKTKIVNQHITTTKTKWTNISKDVRVNTVVNRQATYYKTTYHTTVVNRFNVYKNYNVRYRSYYSGYRSFGFYGGFYYRWAPCYTISDYFWNPVIFWFYNDVADDLYYRSWYGDFYASYPVRYRRFAHVGVYYPTESFRDLAIVVSAMPNQEQLYFKTAMVNLTDNLTQTLSNGLGRPVALNKNEVVVTHYDVLDKNGIVIEGFADTAGRQFSFKALIDLNNAEQTLVFVPTSTDGQPNEAELFTLKEMNNRIVSMGGNPLAEPAADEIADDSVSMDEAALQ